MMITQFNDFESSQPSHDPIEIERTVQEYLGTFEKRMVIFENYMNTSLFTEVGTQSVKPYLENIGNLISEPVSTLHRVVNSKEDLIYYLKDPGVIWDHPESLGVSVWYFGGHGTKNGLEFQRDRLSKVDILELCDGKFSDFPNILYFSSCSLFEDDDNFGEELLKRSGSRGIFGFKEKVPFSIGVIIDLYFLSMFFLYFNEEDPFMNLKSIYNSVLTDIPISQELGFTLFVD